ncbi:hypothetical protein M9H77_12221 [Catharanthus roseus]|uniref:Uncharacterized protein n=1 Tax=Catharanthus roseus TaxID=4058 RepID=A0ACC0BGS8_CATRO|nr:hypothetical protein M9H77_12221 [Catharanthus roseus]
MLATQMPSTKCLPYGCFLMKVPQYFVLNLVGVGDPIGAGKIYDKHTFKRMGFEKNEKGMLVRGGPDDDEESDEDNEDDEENEGQEVMNVDEEESEEGPEEETFRREIRQKKRQEQIGEGQSSRNVTQIMDMITSLQASINSCFDALDGRFDALDGKISNIQEILYIDEQKMHKRSLMGNLQRSKISLKTTRAYGDDVIKLNTLKTIRIVKKIKMALLHVQELLTFNMLLRKLDV